MSYLKYLFSHPVNGLWITHLEETVDINTQKVFSLFFFGWFVSWYSILWFSKIKEYKTYHKDMWILKILVLFFYGERKGGRKRGRATLTCERNINWLVASHNHHWQPGLQPRHVPWLGIKPVTFRFVGCRSNQWVTPAWGKYANFSFYRIVHQVALKNLF